MTAAPFEVSSSSPAGSREPLFTPKQLADINASLTGKTPQEILTWAIDNIPEGGLWQTTAFGLTGLASLAMISEISLSRDETHLVPLIFLDTLHHFPSTLDLAEQAAQRYLAPLHTFKPAGPDGEELADAKEFETAYGEKLWEVEEESYDYLVKSEPQQRAYDTLDVRAVLTGRRRSQGADRSSLPVVELDSTGMIKINPLIDWSFKQVKEYIDKEDVPYNALLDVGYKSIGDWHSTAKPSAAGAADGLGDAGERAGRWAGKAKTECGLHTDFHSQRKLFEKRRREKELKAKDEAKGGDVLPVVAVEGEGTVIVEPTAALGA